MAPAPYGAGAFCLNREEGMVKREKVWYDIGAIKL